MRRYYITLTIIFISLLTRISLSGQELTCDVPGDFQGEVFLNYGSITNAVNPDFRSNITLAQPLVGQVTGQNDQAAFGFWSRYLLPPLAPNLSVSQGDFPDRIQLSWAVDPLSPVTTGGFKIFRDGAFLVNLDDETFEFIDFNVQAGEYYQYDVVSSNQFGTGFTGSAVGFVNPNGVVSGRITTTNGNPVEGAAVTLSPTRGNALSFDGTDDYLCMSYHASQFTTSFTASTWVKIGASYDSDGIVDYGSDLLRNWWIHTTPSGQGKGIVIGVGDGAAQTISYEYIADPDDWHHVTATYNGTSLTLYIDGAYIDSRVASMVMDSMTTNVGRQRRGTDYFDGLIDDVRILDKALSQTEIQQTMLRTLSSSTDGLVAYWKMDEGVGERAFDISNNKIHANIYGATYSSNTPGVLNAGVTDVAGFYLIEGIDYSQGGSFTATPTKDFHFNQALEFSAANLTYAELTDFDIPDSATIEIVFNAFDLSSDQVIFSKSDGFNDLIELSILNETIELSVAGTSHSLGAITKGYHHLALAIVQDGGDVNIDVYLDGNHLGSYHYTGVSQDWSGANWTLGKSRNVGSPRYYTGLVDEVVFFKSILDQAAIQLHAAQGIEVADTNLLSIFNLNEGQGTELLDMGPAITGMGMTQGALRAINVANPEVVPHEFSPNTRQVNINSSNTAVNNIDFTDISTVAISGVVRYKNTVCFAEGVEILVNGTPHVPPIFTDVGGRFVADFEPGADIILTPSFGLHEFFPPFFEVRKIASPVAGVLFQDQTVRNIDINVVGGLCRKSIIPTSKKVTIEIASTGSNCYSKIVDVTSANGYLNVSNLPPLPLSVSVISQTVQEDLTAFFGDNGLNASLDLTTIEKDTVDFIYRVAPQVMTSDLPKNVKGITILEQTKPYALDIEVAETYHGGTCLLDNASIRINNNIADESSFDTLMSSTKLTYTFIAGEPRLVGDHFKNLQVVAETAFGTSTALLSGAVTGNATNETTFASAAPEIPLFILRDPPGDASYAQLTQGQTTCTTWSFEAYDATNTNGFLNVFTGLDVSISTGIGVTKNFEVDATRDFNMDFNATTTQGTSSNVETCFTTTDIFSTSNSEDFIGEEGDVFVGAAINFLYGSVTTLDYDTAACSFQLDTALIIFPDSFATTFIRSERDILTNVIPDLEFLNDTTSVKRWKAILAENDTLKSQAVFKENFSFDAGAVFERSVTTAKTEANGVSYFVEDSENFATELGLTVNGLGLVGGFGVTMTIDTTRDTTMTTANTKTITYVLSDNDAGDNFTLDVLEDRKYGMPVFNLKSGRTMCPHEPNTLKRQKVGMRIDKNVAINIPSNNQAVFFLEVSNLSDEFKVYSIQAFPENNPDGAAIRIGTFGSTSVGLEAGETKQLTMTVGRGPIAYDYASLSVAIYSECEKERADRLGEDLDPLFFKELFFDVHYIEPCSEIDITAPNQDWVVTPDDNRLLNIRLANYDKNDLDLVKVLVQYRRVGGSGAWLPITEVLKDDLGLVSTIVEWDMSPSPLVDGPYEIRAVTNCSSTTLEPGISTVIQGRLETSPPELLGTPQPADGVLSADDEISITYNEYINCDAIVLAERIGTQIFNQNLGLYDKTSGDLIDATISCADDKIFIIPNIQNKFIENRTLEVITDQIEDLSGNKTGEIKWEFLVDRNPLKWLGPDIVELMTVNEPYTVVRQILNNGGTTVGFSIQNIPSWVVVEPNNININPGEIVEINFTFQEDLLIGDYQQEVELVGTEGVEPLDIRLMVRCPAPDWTFTDQALYENTMNFAIELDILGDPSQDISDMIAAYINGEIRGVANVEYVIELDKYIAFLTVYSDVSGEDIEFKVFDGDECIIYAEILESFTYTPGDLVGSPLAPQIIHVINTVERNIPLAPGWNWVSINIDYDNDSVQNVLASLRHPEGVIIKDNDYFAEYLGGLWNGRLTELSYAPRYMLKASTADTLTLLGRPYNLDQAGIPIDTGWNWIGYVPQQGMSIETALGSLNPLNGDIIKSQTAFAQFVAGSGWIGNLNFLEPGVGYLLSISNSGVLTYPEPTENLRTTTLKSRSQQIWDIDPHQHEMTMNIIATFKTNEDISLGESDELGVWIDGVPRGSARPQYIASENGYLLFINVHGDEVNGQIEMKLYNDEQHRIYKVTNQLNYKGQQVLGTVQSPIILEISGEGTVFKPSIDEHFIKNTVAGDVLNNVPDQTIQQGSTFDNIDLDFFLDDTVQCSDYNFEYIISSGVDPVPSSCTIANTQSSMTVFAKITFGDSLAFNQDGDHITLYNEELDIVECITSAPDPFNAGQRIFYLNVRGEVDSYTAKMEFHSAQYQRTFTLDSVFQYVQNANMGSPDLPLLIDVAPLRGLLAGSILEMTIQDTSWTGSQGVIIHAHDCSGDESGIDTVAYNINQIGSPCVDPILLEISASQPTSVSCLQSNADGNIIIDALLADSFSIDGGTTFKADPTFLGLTDGSYDIIVKSLQGCQVSGQVTLINDAYMTVLTRDTTTNCIDRPDVLLNSEVTVGQGPYTYEWKDNLNQPIAPATRVGIGTYYLKITDARSCMDSATITVTQETDPLSWVLPGFMTGADRVCVEATDISYDTGLEPSIGDYVWSYSSGPVTIDTVASGTSMVVDFSPQATDGYVHVAISNLCSSVTDSMMVHINDLGITTEDLSTDCYDDYLVFLEATPASGNAPYTLEWTDEQNNIVDPSIGVHEGTFQVKLTDGDQCTVESALIVTPAVDPLAALTGALVFGPSLVCPDNAISYSAAYPSSYGAISWSSSSPDINIQPSATGEQADIFFNADIPPSYVYITYANACSQQMDSILVTLADPSICSVYADCTTELKVTNPLLNADVYPSQFSASEGVLIDVQISDTHSFPLHPSYQFSAGQEIIIPSGFEVEEGIPLILKIEDCNTGN